MGENQAFKRTEKESGAARNERKMSGLTFMIEDREEKKVAARSTYMRSNSPETLLDT